jgi:non-homologous end joining protein Ku
MKWIEKKAKAGRKSVARDTKPTEAEETGGAEVIDMMALLKRSVQVGGRKGTSSAPAKSKSQTPSKTKRKSSGSRRKAG